MIDRIVSGFLEKYVKDYVEQFTSDNFSIGVLSGTVELSNLVLKRDFLDSLNLPVQILYGYLEKAIIEVPYITIYTNPVVATIRRVFLLCGPRTKDNPYDEKQEQERILSAKKARIQEIEEDIEYARNVMEEGRPDLLRSDLVASIVKNFKICIEDIHICYEDIISNPKSPFSFGLTVKKMTMHSSNTLYPRKSGPCDLDYFRKEITLQFLSIYGNCDKRMSIKSNIPKRVLPRSFIDQIAGEISTPKVTYILKPNMMLLAVWIHRKPSQSGYMIPKFDLDLFIDDFTLKVNEIQLKNGMLVLDSLSRIQLAEPYRKYKPQVPVMDDPIAWWKFAINSIIDAEIGPKRTWKWSHIKEHRRKFKEYKALCLNYFMHGKEEEKMDELELKLDILNIILIRHKVKIQIRKKKVPNKIEGEKMSPKLAHQAENVLSIFEEQLSSEEKKSLMDALNAKPIDYPESFEAYLVNVQIKAINVCLADESLKKLLEFNMDDLSSALSYRPTGGGVEARFQIRDISLRGVDKSELIISKSDGQFLNISAETNPLSKEYDVRLDVKLRKTDFVVHTPTLFSLIELFTAEEHENDAAIEKIEAVAEIKLKEVQKKSARGLEKAIKDALRFNIDVSLDPLTIIVPDHGSLDECKDVMVFKTGELRIFSSDDNRKLSSSPLNQTESNVIQTLRTKAYEVIQLSLSGAQLILTPKGDLKEALETKVATLSIDYLIQPFEFDMIVMRSFVRNDPEMPLLKIKCQTPGIIVETKHSSIIRSVKLLVSIPSPPAKKVKSEAMMRSMSVKSRLQVAKAESEALRDVRETAKTMVEKEMNKDDKKSVSRERRSSTPRGQIIELTSKFVLEKVSYVMKTDDNRELFNFCLEVVSASLEKKTSDMIAYFCFTSLVVKGLDTLKNKKLRIFEAFKSDKLFQVKYEKINNETKLSIELSRFALLVVTDYLIQISKDIQVELQKSSQKPQHDCQHTKIHKTTSSTSHKAPEKPSESKKSSLIFTFRMPQVEIYLLETMDTEDPIAFVLCVSANFDMKAEGGEVLAIQGGIHQVLLGLTGLKRFQTDKIIDHFIVTPLGVYFIKEKSGQRSQVIKIEVVSHDKEILQELPDVKLIISPCTMQSLSSLLKSIGYEEQSATVLLEEEDATGGAKKFFSPKPIEDTSKFEFLSNNTDVVGVREDLVPPSADVAGQSMEKQTLTLTIKSFTIIIESGGRDSQPLVKFFSSHIIVLDDWAENDLKFSLGSEFYMIYHNENKFSWEPVIELVNGKPWKIELKAKMRRDENSATVFLKTSVPLELCLSKSLIALLMDIEKLFIKGFVENSKTDLVRNTVKISNFTSMNLKIFFDNENFTLEENDSSKQESCGDKKTSISIQQGATISLLRIRELQSLTQNIIDCILEYQDKVLKLPLCLKRGGPRCFGFPEADQMKMEYKWILKVEKIGLLSKKVIFGTNVYLINHFDVPLRFYCQISKGNKTEMSFQLEIPADDNFYLPINMIYSQARGKCLWIKPSESYGHSSDGLTWDPKSVRSNPNMTLRCESTEKNENFYIRVRRDLKEIPFGTSNKASSDHLFTTIRLYPMMLMRNFLPIMVEMTFADKSKGGSVKKFLMKPGQVAKVTNIDLGRSHEISMRISNYLNREWMCKNTIPSNWENGEYLNWTFTQTGGKESLSLAIDLAEENDDCRVASLFSPFWMINNTGRKLIYKICDQTLEHPLALKVPLLLCPKGKSSSDQKISISFEDSNFSDPISIASAGNKGNFVAKGKNDFTYCASVETKLSAFILTNIVKISPYYLIINKTNTAIEITDNDKNWTLVKRKSKCSLWPESGECFIIIRDPFQKNQPSNRISLKNPLSILCTVNDEILAVNVDIQESEIVVRVSDYFQGSAPVRIFNLLETSLIYGQSSIKYHTQLPSFHYTYFTWHDPSKFPLTLIWSSEATMNTETEIDISTDSVEKSPEGEVYCACFVYAQQRTLLITKDRALTQASTQQAENDNPTLDIEIIIEGIGISLVDDILQREVMYISITSSDLVWEVREYQKRHFKPLKVQQIEMIEEAYQQVKNSSDSSAKDRNQLVRKVDDLKINLTDTNNMKVLEPFQGDLRRVHWTGIWIGVSVSEHLTQFHLKLFRLQIDNQMDDCVFPVVICRKPPPRSVALDREPKPFLEISSVLQKQMNLTRFNYLAVLIQELMVQVDGNFLLALNEFFSISESSETNFEESLRVSIEQAWEDHTDYSEIAVSSKIHYDHIHISPVKAEVSFTLADGRTISLIPTIDFLLRSVCIALSEFRGVVFKINFFERRNVLMDNSEIISEISEHYSRQLLKQFYVVVLGFGVLGNPVGVLLGLGQGIGDFFYEPYMGIIQGPQEFVKGVGIGVRSLMRGTVGGAAGAMEKITGTLGQGIATLSMDDEAIQRRQEQLNRRTNIAESGGMFVKGVTGGITGVVTKPVKGAQKEGVKGLMKGLGRGVVGMVADPVTGALDFASGAFSNVKNAVDDSEMVIRQRLPRNFYPDEIIRPYNGYDALGRFMFKRVTRGESNDQYTKHFNLADNNVLIFTDERIILVKQGSPESYEQVWEQSFNSIESVQIVEKIKLLIHFKFSSLIPSNILRFIKQTSKGHRVIICSAQSSEVIKMEIEGVLKKGQTRNLPPSIFSA